MNQEKFIQILQLVVAGFSIATPGLQAVQIAKVIGASAALYKEMTGKPVDEALIKEYEPIT